MGLNLRALYDMSDAERAAFHQRSDANFAERLVDIRQQKARLKPVAKRSSPRTRRGDEKVCVAMVVLTQGSTGVTASTDGSAGKAVFLPFKASIDLGTAYGRWTAITMPKWLRNDRELHLKNRADMPAPKVQSDFPSVEQYQASDDCARADINYAVWQKGLQLQPGACFTRKSNGGSAW